jgi:hypothetical protein
LLSLLLVSKLNKTNIQSKYLLKSKITPGYKIDLERGRGILDTVPELEIYNQTEM